MKFKKGHTPHNKGDSKVDMHYRDRPREMKTHRMMKEKSYGVMPEQGVNVSKTYSFAKGKNNIFDTGIKL